MQIKSQIESKLTDALQPEFLDVRNESHMHSVPPNSETHFRVTVVSEAFKGARRVNRHQRVFGLLNEELQGAVHALALHAFTPDEWRERRRNTPESPACLGGSKNDLK